MVVNLLVSQLLGNCSRVEGPQGPAHVRIVLRLVLVPALGDTWYTDV